MPAQGQASTLHCSFLGGAEQGPSAQTSPVPWELHWKTNGWSPAWLHPPLPTHWFSSPSRPVQAMLVLGVGWAESLCPGQHCSSSGPCFLPRKAVKATLVLLPLLGITYMLFFVNPGEDEISRIVFIYFNSFLESFQVMVLHIGSHPSPLTKEEPILADASSHFCPFPKPDISKPQSCFKAPGSGVCCDSAACLLPGLLRLCLLLLLEQ